MKLTDKIRRDWHYYAVALGLILFLMAWWGCWGLKLRVAILRRRSDHGSCFWIAGFVIRRRPAEEA